MQELGIIGYFIGYAQIFRLRISQQPEHQFCDHLNKISRKLFQHGAQKAFIICEIRIDKISILFLTHKMLAIRGEMPRGEVSQLIQMSERTGRNILKELLDEGLVLSRSEKGAIRLGFPTKAASYWFPDLYPNEARH